MKFYVEPIIAEQNSFNANVVCVINSTKTSVDELLIRVEELEKRQAELQQEIDLLRQENAKLKAN